MGARNSRVRTKVTALLVSLTALWVFAAWVTLREGLNLLWVNTLDSNVGQPSNSLLHELQQERRLTLVYLGSGRLRERKELADQRTRTDAAVATFRESATSGGVDFAANDSLKASIATVLKDLNGLGPARTSIDAGRTDRAQALDLYSGIIRDQYHMYGSLSTLDDQSLARDIRSLISASQAREALAQEDAFLSGVLAGGRMTVAENREFVRLVGVQRYLFDKVLDELPPADRQRYQKLQAGSGYVRMRTLENLAMQTGPRAALPLDATDWDEAAGPVQRDLRNLELAGGQDVVERSRPFAVGVIVRLVLAGGLGLIAVIASIVLAITTARALIRQLERLAEAARRLAEERLPSVVERLGHGERVDVNAEAPPLEFGSDAIGQVGQAFNHVQRTAIHTAVEQAELRQGIRDILLSLARRTQSLVHRQLTLLDTMERREADAEELKDLFRVDHLATRMRRNAENLIVLSGASPGRAWRRPIPMIDVVRGALGEVEDYTRVTLMPIAPVDLAGRAVGDVIHLLAELVENAVSFSPPYTTVQISGQLVANGHVIEIEDRGLGMSPEDLAAANERLANPPEFNPASTAQLGLFVVSHLAERHGIKVALKGSLYGGTTAVVLVPRELIVGGAEFDPDAGPPPSTPLAIGKGPGLAADHNGDRGAENGAAPLTTGEIEGPGAGRRIAVAGSEQLNGRRSAGRPDDLAAGRPVGRALPAQAVPPQSVPDQSVPGPRAARAIFTDQENARVVEHPATAEHDGTRVIEADPARIAPPDRPRPEADGPSHDDPARRDAPPPAEGSPAEGSPAGESPAEPAEPAKPQEPKFTPSGLPFRVPQANLAPALRAEPAADEPAAAEPEAERSPEDVRRIMGAFQAGTRRGRRDAAQSSPDKSRE